MTAPPSDDMESLLDTTAGLALAHTAWQEGASGMLRSVNEHESGPWSKPENPYSAPLLAARRARRSTPPTDDEHEPMYSGEDGNGTRGFSSVG